MLLPAGLSGYAFTYDNWGANPSTTPGTSVIPGASNGEGGWTQVASSANIAQDCYWIMVTVLGGSTSTAAKNHLLDIGVDPAGGTSYSAIISNLVCGCTAALGSGLRNFRFPFFIKSGSSVAVRVQGSNATAGTVRVCVKFYGQPTNPENVPVGAIAQTLGSITNSNGTSFTPGNAADGTYVSLGTTTTPLWWWQLGVQIDNGTQSAHQTYIDLAVGNVTNKKVILRNLMFSSTGEVNGDVFAPNQSCGECFWPVPAGAEIWIRGRNNAAPVTGYNATVIGIGG
jgi:hypothetical protein